MAWNRTTQTRYADGIRAAQTSYSVGYDNSGRMISQYGTIDKDNRTQRIDKSYKYSYRGLLKSYTSVEHLYITNGDCPSYTVENLSEWQYRYNPFGEREQKRLYQTPGHKASVKPWVYYQLGVDNRQHSVYYGFESYNVYLNLGGNCDNSLFWRSSCMFPGEFNSFGLGSVPAVSWKLEKGRGWTQHYSVCDYLGSVRASFSSNDIVNSISLTEYTPYGEVEEQYNASSGRLKYIGKERDQESGDANHGVRQYSQRDGRFYCPDALWEIAYSQSPYHYASNNPITKLDPSGLIDYIYNENGAFSHTENDWGFFDFLHSDSYYVQLGDGTRLEANSKETVTEKPWTSVWADWGTHEDGYNARVAHALSSHNNMFDSPLLQGLNLPSNLLYALEQSKAGGLIDQKQFLLEDENKIPHMLYVKDGIAYNWREAGNYVWGGVMATLDIPWQMAYMGAHGYKLSISGEFDEGYELRAALRAYNYELYIRNSQKINK